MDKINCIYLFGLAIVKELVEASDGSCELKASSFGGVDAIARFKNN
jgi:hypothetical protein